MPKRKAPQGDCCNFILIKTPTYKQKEREPRPLSSFCQLTQPLADQNHYVTLQDRAYIPLLWMISIRIGFIPPTKHSTAITIRISPMRRIITLFPVCRSGFPNYRNGFPNSQSVSQWAPAILQSPVDLLSSTFLSPPVYLR